MSNNQNPNPRHVLFLPALRPLTEAQFIRASDIARSREWITSYTDAPERCWVIEPNDQLQATHRLASDALEMVLRNEAF